MKWSVFGGGRALVDRLITRQGKENEKGGEKLGRGEARSTRNFVSTYIYIYTLPSHVRMLVVLVSYVRLGQVGF